MHRQQTCGSLGSTTTTQRASHKAHKERSKSRKMQEETVKSKRHEVIKLSKSFGHRNGSPNYMIWHRDCIHTHHHHLKPHRFRSRNKRPTTPIFVVLYLIEEVVNHTRRKCIEAPLSDSHVEVGQKSGHVEVLLQGSYETKSSLT